MRRSALLVVLSCSVLASVSGCGGGGYSAHLVIGPYEGGSSAQLWERTLAAVSATRYQPEQVDPSRGQILVPSRTYGSRERFLVQLYREGWVQVALAPQAGVWRSNIPSNLSEEHVAFTIALREQLEGEAEVSSEEVPPPPDDEEPAS